MAPASADDTPGTRPTEKETTVDKVRIAREERAGKLERDERDRSDKREGDRLYDVLAALPFERRIEAIERMAQRMGV
jgi:hypothetical protein